MVKKVAKRKTAKRKARKKVAKRIPKKKVAKRKAKKKVAKRKAKKKAIKKTPPNFTKSSGGVLVPKKESNGAVVKPSKLKEGLRKARDEIHDIFDSVEDFADGYEVAEITMAVSFSADGKFLGVGVGGATSMEIKLTPSED
jgi:hypothetical protein